MPYRGLLTLYAGAVEPQSWDAVRVALDVEDALVVSLPRLRLGQVLGQQGDRPHDAGGDVDLGGGQDLRTLLEMRKIRIRKLRCGQRRKQRVSVRRRCGWTECSGCAAGGTG